jgi:ABC-type branched-subunit amino acid transport system ATPase component
MLAPVTEAAMRPLLSLDAVTVGFGGLKALDGLSLTVGEGEFVGIVGPNGAGKSTLIQTVTGFTRPAAGTIKFADRRINRKAPETIAALGIARTFQTSRVFPGLSVEESVLVGVQRRLVGGGRLPRRFGALLEPAAAILGLPAYARAEAEGRAKVEAVLKLFGDRLWSRRDNPAHSLSYANRRRLDIGRALAAEPDLLFLDEPTAGMNPTESHELADLLLDLRRRFPAMTVVMIEHKLDIVRRLAGRAVVIAAGRTIVDDTPDAAFAHSEVAAAYLGRASYRGQTAGAAAVPASAGHLQHDPVDATPMRDASAVALDKVDVFYGPVQALFGVSIHVGQGEAVAVLGGNASGKSTTLKTVLRLVGAKAGAVRLFGEPQPRDTAAVIGLGVASIPEGRRMFAELTVRDNLLMGAYPRRGEDRKALAADLERVLAEFPWLSGRLDQLAGTLSGGEQQMVALGRAWLRRPRLLCIDEPSMGLSPLMVERVYEILARWKRQGLTMLMVEQSANQALELVDRAYVLRSGHVVLAGTSAALKADPAIQEAYLGARDASPARALTA